MSKIPNTWRTILLSKITFPYLATATPHFCVRDDLKVTLRKKTAASRLGPSQNYDLCGRAGCTAKAHNSCLRKTLRTFWPRKNSNNLLFKRTEREDMGIVVVKIRWPWISYALLTRWYALLSPTSIFKSDPRWTPEACKGATGYVVLGRFVVIVYITEHCCFQLSALASEQCSKHNDNASNNS